LPPPPITKTSLFHSYQTIIRKNLNQKSEKL